MSSTNQNIVEALAAALEPLRASIEDVQIYPYWLDSATPPTLDIYTGNPFREGGGSPACFFTVRARASTADSDAGQQLLLSLLDVDGPTSVEAALVTDQTLGGAVDSLAVVSVSGEQVYLEDTAVNGKLLGCEWRVEVLT